MAKAKLPMAPYAEHRVMVAGLLRAARGEPEPPELARLRPTKVRFRHSSTPTWQ